MTRERLAFLRGLAIAVITLALSQAWSLYSSYQDSRSAAFDIQNEIAFNAAILTRAKVELTHAGSPQRVHPVPRQISEDIRFKAYERNLITLLGRTRKYSQDITEYYAGLVEIGRAESARMGWFEGMKDQIADVDADIRNFEKDQQFFWIYAGQLRGPSDIHKFYNRSIRELTQMRSQLQKNQSDLWENGNKIVTIEIEKSLLRGEVAHAALNALDAHLKLKSSLVIGASIVAFLLLVVVVLPPSERTKGSKVGDGPSASIWPREERVAMVENEPSSSPATAASTVRDQQVETLRFLIGNALRQWNERRTYEWRALLGFLTLAISGGAMIARDRPPWLYTTTSRVAFTFFFLLAAGAVVWYLVALQCKNKKDAARNEQLNNKLAKLTGLDCSDVPPPPPYKLWALWPQLLFIVAVSIALLILLWAVDP